MPDVVIKVGSIILLLGGLIFVHELGHFVVAKLLGVKVVRFSIGFGPRLFGFVRGETEYRISLLPLGGYVKMAGDDPTEVTAPEDRGRGFLEQAPWRRLLIALAGPAANLVFPAIVYFAAFALQNGEPVPGPVIGTVAPGSPAAAAGLLPGDRVVSVGSPGGPSKPVRDFPELRDLVGPHPGEPLAIEVEREGRILALELTPASEDDGNPLESTRHGVIGVTPSYAPAVVAPVRPGAAGPLEPFDLVVRAGGAPVKNAHELDAALAAARCAPLDLVVLRERTLALPGAAVAKQEPVSLAGVPTCLPGGERSLAVADAMVSGYVALVLPGSPAEQAGLRRGDAIVSLEGRPIRSLARDLQAKDFEPGKPVKLGLSDGRVVELVPGKDTLTDPATGKSVDRPVTGFYPDRRPPLNARALVASEVPVHRTVGEMAALASAELNRTVRLTVLSIGKLFTGEISFKTVGGPIMLFEIASGAAEQGWSVFLATMALVSINLGLMNLLPIPVLDGGHIVQALLEAVTRRPLSLRTREIANIVGLVLLVTLMIFVFKNDIMRHLTPME